jgi:CubicO group peptidase (beta-lactamase class C family)
MTEIKNVFMGCILLALCSVSHAIENTNPAHVGVIPQRLERIDAAINAAVTAGEIPGAVALVIRDGKIVYHEAFGYADIKSKRSMKTDAIFRIASMTKAITSTGIMMLYEQGHFGLGDPVSEFLPEFSTMRIVSEVDDDSSVVATVPAEKQIRIVDLLTHTSGLAYKFIPGKLQKTYSDAGIIDGLTANQLVLADNIELLAKQPLLFEPGSKFNYSLSTDVLGRLIEVVSGQPLDQFFADHITGPLGMEDTWFYLPADKHDRLVTLYSHVDGEGLTVAKGDESSLTMIDPNYPIVGARTYFSGGAGLSSTAYDYGRFVQMLLNDGQLEGVRILSRKSVELMRTPRIDWDDDQTPDFGLGFVVISDLGKGDNLGSVGAYSWGGAFYTSYWVDPREGLVAVFMSQGRPIQSDIAQVFKTLVYQALE